ncbi:MAG: DNA polymerase III subunit gamma/tau [Vicinamibacterales bacterium]|jgi:DNA polymerase-3 subunit gamma/tau|nr:DNA polymerase III subunit gamma/tau [Acidobacteriota bacterium]MDP7295584.1 DNA polymerase III subunit gamma/tau [Vicinamibacterales bacterium]MDP7670673.1 DNA polymerase III subunit gamma/tau [Vicinamibacterales bacterium]HJO39044.1 DNA polymerase III subunit gamma/tau [Vicinamibacterales bacterium]
MAYQVIARKWRPQKFDDVVGQRGVTQTLRNAISSDRIAQAYVFAGPRGVGKTTTARILARALNCVGGPTPEPCGKCDACLEIAEGRDIDVLELDAATHTGIDNVREVIIAGLAMAPVRDRYKMFLIDEFHQLSKHSFNALLKSIEEPPPHVVFMMVTTELAKIPDTILSRSQIFEFRTIGAAAIADQVHTITKAEKITIDDGAVGLLARAADGSMRDALSALDQVIAFAGEQIAADDVSTVLGLVGRDLLFDAIEAVADERASDLFELAGRFVEAGYDLRLVCRELSRVCRDLLVLAIDSSRFDDAEVAPEGDRDRLRALVPRFSREDLMRAFDVLSRADVEIRNASQPRYHLEMALLRWVHLRHLVPLADLIDGLESGAPVGRAGGGPAAPPQRRPSPARSVKAKTPTRKAAPPVTAAAAPQASPAPPAAARAESAPANRSATAAPASDDDGGDLKRAWLAEVQRAKKFFYGTVVAQAQRVVMDGDRITFTFAPNHRTLQTQLEQNRPWLEKTASELAERKIQVIAEQGTAEAPPPTPTPTPAPDATTPAPADESLKAEAMDDAAVQAMLDVFPAEIRGVEEV